MSSQLGLMTAISYVKHPKMSAHSRKTSSCKRTGSVSQKLLLCCRASVIVAAWWSRLENRMALQAANLR